MAGTFPTLKTGRIAFYGTVQALARKTEVIQFCTGAEQRFKSAQPLFSATLEYVEGNFYDLGLLQDFHRTQKGQFDTWSITIEDPPGTNTTYNNMTFMSDEFLFQETKIGRFSVSLKVRQERR